MNEQGPGYFPPGTEPPKKKQSGGMFKKDAATPGIDFNQISNEINNISRRLRILEERYINIRNKTQVTDQNMLATNKRVSGQIREVNDDLKDVKTEIKDIQEKIKIIIKELQLCAKKDAVNVLERYINMWEPVNFVTEKEVEKIVRSILEDEGKSNFIR